MSEKRRLNQIGLSILRENGFDDTVYYDQIRTMRGAGYAHQYLKECWNDLEMLNEADVSIYRQLVDIDSKLGTSASQQLHGCLSYTTRWDLIQVVYTYKHRLKFIQDD